MRQQTRIATAVIAFLVSGPVFAGNGEGGALKEEIEARNKIYREKEQRKDLKKAYADTYKKEFAKLSDADQETFRNIIQTSAESNTPISKQQLLGFMKFTSRNTDAKCSVERIEKGENRFHYQMLQGEDRQLAKDVKHTARKQYQVLGIYGRKPGHSPLPNRGLVCTSGSKKRWFSNLPATVLNQFKNDNVLLANESAVDTQTNNNTTIVTTALSGYAVQSVNELRAPSSEENVFAPSALTTSGSDSVMGFTSGTAGSVK